MFTFHGQECFMEHGMPIHLSLAYSRFLATEVLKNCHRPHSPQSQKCYVAL